MSKYEWLDGVTADPRLKPVAKLVALAIYKHCGATGQSNEMWAYPSYPRIAESIGVKPRRFTADVRALETAGWVVVSKMPDRHERSKTFVNRYDLTFPTAEQSAVQSVYGASPNTPMPEHKQGGISANTNSENSEVASDPSSTVQPLYVASEESTTVQPVYGASEFQEAVAAAVAQVLSTVQPVYGALRESDQTTVQKSLNHRTKKSQAPYKNEQSTVQPLYPNTDINTVKNTDKNTDEATPSPTAQAKQPRPTDSAQESTNSSQEEYLPESKNSTDVNKSTDLDSSLTQTLDEISRDEDSSDPPNLDPLDLVELEDSSDLDDSLDPQNSNAPTGNAPTGNAPTGNAQNKIDKEHSMTVMEFPKTKKRLEEPPPPDWQPKRGNVLTETDDESDDWAFDFLDELRFHWKPEVTNNMRLRQLSAAYYAYKPAIAAMEQYLMDQNLLERTR